MTHKQQSYIEQLISANVTVKLIGEAGTGKSTIVINAAENAGIPYSFMTGSRQSSKGDIVGFMSVNGTYVPSPFRVAYEQGHYFNIEEMNAMDPNLAILFNSLDNNKMAFPDGYFEPPHPNFRLIATENPVSKQFGARTQADFSTSNRFYTVRIDKDEDLALTLTSQPIIDQVNVLRNFLEEEGASQSYPLTMRDELLLKQLINLGLDEYPLLRLIDEAPKELRTKFASKQEEFIKSQKALIDEALVQEKRLAEEKAKKENYDKLTQHEVNTLEQIIDKII